MFHASHGLVEDRPASRRLYEGRLLECQRPESDYARYDPLLGQALRMRDYLTQLRVEQCECLYSERPSIGDNCFAAWTARRFVCAVADLRIPNLHLLLKKVSRPPQTPFELETQLEGLLPIVQAFDALLDRFGPRLRDWPKSRLRTSFDRTVDEFPISVSYPTRSVLIPEQLSDQMPLLHARQLLCPAILKLPPHRREHFLAEYRNHAEQTRLVKPESAEADPISTVILGLAVSGRLKLFVCSPEGVSYSLAPSAVSDPPPAFLPWAAISTSKLTLSPSLYHNDSPEARLEGAPLLVNGKEFTALLNSRAYTPALLESVCKSKIAGYKLEGRVPLKAEFVEEVQKIVPTAPASAILAFKREYATEWSKSGPRSGQIRRHKKGT